MKRFISALPLLAVIACVLLAQTTPVTHTVTLSWAASTATGGSTPPVITYNVYKYGGFPGNVATPPCPTDTTVYQKVGSALTVTSFSETGLADGVTRCYYVTAQDSAGESAPSPILTVLMVSPVTVPNAITVTNVKITTP